MTSPGRRSPGRGFRFSADVPNKMVEMHYDPLLDDPPFAVSWPTTGRDPIRVVIAAVLTALISIATCVVAILAPAPAAAVPLVIAICFGCPVFAGWEVPTAIAYLSGGHRHRKAFDSLARDLGQLPEIDHPLGF